MLQRHRLKSQIENERKKKRLISYTAFFLMVVYLTISLFFDDMGFIKYMHLRNYEKNLTAEISSLENDTNTLYAEIENLQTDPFYIEKHAREDLNLSRPDEFIFLYEK